MSIGAVRDRLIAWREIARRPEGGRNARHPLGRPRRDSPRPPAVGSARRSVLQGVLEGLEGRDADNALGGLGLAHLLLLGERVEPLARLDGRQSVGVQKLQ